MARITTKLDYVLDVYIDCSMVNKEHSWENFHFNLLYHNFHSETYNVDLCDLQLQIGWHNSQTIPTIVI